MKPTVSGYCFNHDPERSAARAQARRAGGAARHTPHAGDPDQVSKAPRTIPEVQTILDYTLQELLTMDNGIPRARALISLAGVYGDLIKTGELETQLKELLRVLEARA